MNKNLKTHSNKQHCVSAALLEWF